MGSTAARAYAGVGVTLIALYVAIGESAWLYDGLVATSVLAIAGATAHYRPRASRGWAAIAAAEMLRIPSDILSHAAAPTAPYPLAPAAFSFGSAVLFAAGVGLLMGRGFDWRDRAGHLDALLVTVALGIASWTLLLDRQLSSGLHGVPPVAFAQPLVDLVAAGLLIRIAIAPGKRTSAFWLASGAVTATLLADTAYVLPEFVGGHQPGLVLDGGWLLGCVLIATAALLPSMESLAGEDGRSHIEPSRRVVAGGIALVLFPLSALIQHVTSGGVDVVVLTVGGMVVIGGMVVRVVFLIRKLDRLRRRAEESERRFRMVFERAPVGISIGRNGIMSETNPALQRMLGYTGDELARTHYSEITVSDEHARAVQNELDAGTRNSFSTEKQYIRRDGSGVDARVHVVLDLDDGLGMSVIEDVTEQRALEAQLRHVQKMEAVGKLAGGVAHDFNNLMTVVIGYSDLLLRGGVSESNGRVKLTEIRRAAVRASELTQQLLAFSRRQVLQADEIDLRDVVHRMEVMLRRVLGEQVRFEMSLASEPVIVRADPLQLEQVVMNLALNASDAMSKRGTLTVSVGSDVGEAVLTVTDDGIGMDEATQARIFEPFFTTKSLVEGAGLGLSTVHGIVGQSGGTIGVESCVGGGSTFTVRLPEQAALATVVD